MRSRVYSWYTVFSEMQFISGIGNQPELSSEIGTTWAELSWADVFMDRVVLGRLVFGPSCPEPIPFLYLAFEKKKNKKKNGPIHILDRLKC